MRAYLQLTRYCRYSLPNMSIGGINPNDLGNMGEIEQQFAVKTVEHLEVSPGNRRRSIQTKTDPRRSSRWQTYQRVILNIPPSTLKLTKSVPL